MNEINIEKMWQHSDAANRSEVLRTALVGFIQTNGSERQISELEKLPVGSFGLQKIKDLCDICGKENANNIAKKLFMIRDEKMEFHDGPAKAEMRVRWNDDFHKTTPCLVNPQTHEVYGFDEDPFKRPDPEDRAWLESKSYLGSVDVIIHVPALESYSFECVECTGDSDNIDVFWYRRNSKDLMKKVATALMEAHKRSLNGAMQEGDGSLLDALSKILLCRIIQGNEKEIANRASFLIDIQNHFQDGPIMAMISVEWADNFEKDSPCQIDQRTFKVSGFDDDLFNREISDQNIEIKRIIVYTATSVNDYYFECEKTGDTIACNKCWYRPHD